MQSFICLLCSANYCYTIIYLYMFGWLSRCWGGMGVTTQFQRARIRSMITDWKVPTEDDVCVIINSFKGDNPQIQQTAAINMFMTHMESDEERNDPIFLLKCLYILDQAVQQRTALNAISSYYSSVFFTFKTGANIHITPIREFIAAYFLYIKKKAQFYSQIDSAYFSKKEDRKLIVQQCDSDEIFSLMDKCFEMQRNVNGINSKYKGGNKSMELMQMIYAMLLKSYLFCYTLVSTCVRVLFKKISKMTKDEVVRLNKSILYYNKDYTRNFIDFIESNKEIPIFGSIKYSELILIDRQYLQYLDNHIRNMENQPQNYSLHEQIRISEENNILSIPQAILQKMTQEIRIAHQFRKLNRINNTKFNLYQQKFQQYNNLYSEQYDSNQNTQKMTNYNTLEDKQNVSTIPSQNKIIKLRKVEFDTTLTLNFNDKIWRDCNNVYSS